VALLRGQQPPASTVPIASLHTIVNLDAAARAHLAPPLSFLAAADVLIREEPHVAR
jgi:hypothetical protein